MATISVLNTDANLSGKTIAVAEEGLSINGAWIFTAALRCNGTLQMATALTTGASSGDIVLDRGKTLRSANVGSTTALSLISLDTGNFPVVGGDSVGIRIPAPVAASLAAAGSASGLIAVDTTNNRFVFYSGGLRYFVTGTSF